MATEEHVRPALFTTEGDHPALLGGRCQACGYVFFPMQAYGCEACGSTELQPAALIGKGKLIAFARVHVHPSPARQAPFTVGSIVTDDGAVVRALIDEACAEDLRSGMAMVTKLAPETRPGRGEFDLRFTAVDGGES